MADSKTMLRVAHVITGLEIGGAENMLYKLVKQHESENVQSTVISLGKLGPIGEKLELLNIDVEVLNFRRGAIPSIFGFIRFLSIIRARKPQILQGWMYHGNIAVTLAAFFIAPRPKVYWNIRQSLGPLEHERNLTRKLIRVSALLSRIPSAIIYNSRVSAEQHSKLGYCKKREKYIPNGFDVCQFRPDTAIREKIRKGLGISEETILVGHIARFHPKKDHRTFFNAAKKVIDVSNDVIFLGVGRDVERKNELIWQHIEALELQNSVILLGEKSIVSDIYCALDLFVSSSKWGEGFPNNIGEAMATGLYCIATDVGESKELLGETGKVIAPGDFSGLGKEILSFADQRSAYWKKGRAARGRICKLYAIDKIGRDYLSLYGKGYCPGS